MSDHDNFDDLFDDTLTLKFARLLQNQKKTLAALLEFQEEMQRIRNQINRGNLTAEEIKAIDESIDRCSKVYSEELKKEIDYPMNVHLRKLKQSLNLQ